MLPEVLDLYDELYKNQKKEPIDPRIAFNEIHDYLNYDEEEIKIIIQQAQILRNKQNQ